MKDLNKMTNIFYKLAQNIDIDEYNNLIEKIKNEYKLEDQITKNYNALEQDLFSKQDPNYTKIFGFAYHAGKADGLMFAIQLLIEKI